MARGTPNALRFGIRSVPGVKDVTITEFPNGVPGELRLDVNTMARVHGIALPPAAPLLHFAARQDVRVWPIVPVRPDDA